MTGIAFRRFALASVGALFVAGCFKMNERSELQVGKSYHGFRVTGVTELPEAGGRMWRLAYERNGADVAWLDRPDDNKTFGIAFRTLPEDDTGVAHILEHSVLCGSAKYPVKEPFVDLLKGSLATFLNAFTSKDQTVYPVSSRNDRDFLNLTDVYLDAVFHPRSVTTPVMFQQEGWHYEFGKDGTLVRNGVVYNEMKGVYSNPESVMFEEICRLLFPDTPYRYDSGGDPEHIGELTFEQYKAFYFRHYHPSNARIFLDGAIPVDATLAKLDAYLSAFDRNPAIPAIPVQKPVAKSAMVPYAIGAGESPKDKTLLAEGWVFAGFDDRVRIRAFDVLAELLAGSNEAPLKKTLLAKGLCADLALESFGFRQAAGLLFAKNVPDGRADEFRATVRATLADLAAKGLDRERLAAILDRREFQAREFLSGGGSTGVKFLNAALDQWLYGGDPAAAFVAAADFEDLRAKVGAGWFERFLREALLDNPHHAALTMTPSAALAAERVRTEAEGLAKTLAGWDEADKKRVRAETAAVDAFRNKVDTPEELATLPVLALSDIPVRGKERAVRETTVGGVPVVRVPAGAKGVFYLALRFDVDDFTDAELAELPFFATALGELATRDHTALALHTALDAGLGRFHTGVRTYAARPDDTAHAHTVFTVDVAALDAKTPDMARLVPEVLLTTSFADRAAVTDLLGQVRLARERETTTIEARNLARRRAAASFSAKAAVEDVLSGMTQLRHAQAAEKRFAADPAAAEAAFAALAKRLFTRARLTAFVSDNYPEKGEGDLAALVSAFPEGTPVVPAARPRPPRRREGFSIAGDAAYAAQAMHLDGIGVRTDGAARVAARLLSLTYLWDEIRVKGGAYGGGLQAATDGALGFLSWRDPQPARSLDCYAQAAQALRTFAQGTAPLDRYVVGTIGANDPCLTPRGETELAADLRFSGQTYEDLQRTRGEILATTKGDLVAFADRLDRLARDTSVCVIGGARGLAACSNRLDSVEAVVETDAKKGK